MIIALFIAFGSAIVIFLIWFNRDPERLIPFQSESVNKEILSPADGRILYVRGIRAGDTPVCRKFKREVLLSELDGDFVSSGNIVVGIYLSPFDVHVTRAPISGHVTLIKYRKGNLFSSDLLRFATNDEMSLSVITGNEIKVAIVQMAAYLVRRVVLNIKEKDVVAIGSRIGKIKMGSQVDLVIQKQANLTILVKPGDKVRAGQSIIAKLGAM